MANKQNIRIAVTRREPLDVEKLATALLDLVEQLTPEDRLRLAIEGERILKEVKSEPTPKRSAR